MAAALYAARFLLELALVAAFAAWGWQAVGEGVLGAAAGVAGAGAVVVLWGLLVAPRAKRRLADPGRLGVEVALFALGGAALWSVWSAPAALVLFASSSTIAVATRIVADPFAGASAQ